MLLKLYESVILSRSKSEMTSPISQEQGGFQDGLSCLMTSFILRESMHFANEFKSKVHAYFMDGRKAVDVVWHEGLMHTLLFESGIDNTTVVAFNVIYTNMSSCV